VLVAVEVAVTLSGIEELPASLGERVVLITHRIEVTAKPNAIPAELVVDVAGITEDEPIRLSSVSLPAGVTTEVDPETVLAELSSLQLDPEIAEEEAAAEAEAEAAAEDAADGESGASEGSSES
jgi:large subunit ribosomal protein L25